MAVIFGSPYGSYDYRDWEYYEIINIGIMNVTNPVGACQKLPAKGLKISQNTMAIFVRPDWQ
jgi:hypothetical protein